MTILSMLAMAFLTFNVVEIQNPNQAWVIRNMSCVNQNDDVAIMVGPPSKTFNMKVPIPWETYAVVLKYHESNMDVHFIVESKGTQNLAWRNYNGKQSLTAIVAPIDPNVSQWLDITLGDEGYEVQQNMLPQDVVPYDLSWNPSGTILVLALTRFPTAQSTRLENYLAVVSDDFTSPLHVKFSFAPKMIVWRDSSVFYAQSGETMYIVDIKNESIEPKPILTRPGITFHSYEEGMLIYSDGNDLFVHEKKIYTFQRVPGKVCFDYPYLALQDDNAVMLLNLSKNDSKKLTLQENDFLIGINAFRHTIFVRRGLTAIDKLRFMNGWERENIFEISDVYPAYSSSERKQRKRENETGSDQQKIEDSGQN